MQQLSAAARGTEQLVDRAQNELLRNGASTNARKTATAIERGSPTQAKASARAILGDT